MSEEALAPNPVENILDLLTDRFAPEEKTVKIEVMEDTWLEFEVLSDEVRHSEVMKAGAIWVAEMIENANRNTLTKAWKEIWANDPKLLGEVYLLGTIAITEGAKDKYRWFKMARKAAPAFRTIYTKVTLSTIKTKRQREEDTVMKEKKGSKATPGTGSRRNSPGSSSRSRRRT